MKGAYLQKGHIDKIFDAQFLALERGFKKCTEKNNGCVGCNVEKYCWAIWKTYVSQEKSKRKVYESKLSRHEKRAIKYMLMGEVKTALFILYKSAGVYTNVKEAT